MSVKVMGLVWDLEIPPNEKLVLLAYADHADHEGYSIFPSVKLIAEKTGYQERNVQLVTRALEGRGLLIPDGVSKSGTNKWRIPLYMGAILYDTPRGAKITPPEGAKITPGGCTPVHPGGASGYTPGVHPSTPEPSVTINKPSDNIYEKEQNAWSTTLRELFYEMGNRYKVEMYESFPVVEVNGGIITIRAGDKAEYMNSRLKKSVENVMAGVLDIPVTVNFV